MSEQEISVGVVLVDKPVGPSSFRVVQQVRHALKVRKVGHAGTLDPFASGLLVVGVGRLATRLMPLLMAGDKEYLATLRLGIETETQDLTGRIIAEKSVPELTRDRLDGVLRGFVGELMQRPPQFSAVKYQGKPLYAYARKGIEVVKPPRRIFITKLELLDFDLDTLSLRVVGSKGTYVRTLAADIGAALGCGGHLTSLRRLRSGPFSVEDAVPGLALADREGASSLLADHLMTVDHVMEKVGRPLPRVNPQASLLVEVAGG